MKRIFVIAMLLPLLLALLALAAGSTPGAAFTAVFESALGSPYAIHSSTLVRWAPLALTGLAVALAFQAGVWNIGAEGQLLAGAAAAYWGAAVFGATGGLLTGAAAGAAWAALAGVWMTRFGASVVIVTLMLNFVADLGVSLLVNGPLQEPTGIYPQTAPLDAAGMLLRLEGTRMHSGIPLTLLLVFAGWFLLYRTRRGFDLRLTGANPTAARYAGGIDTSRVRFWTLLGSGALAGLAGAIELTGVTGVLYERFSPGYGFMAIAVAMAGALHPLGVAAAALFFAVLEAGATGLQRDAGIPAVMTLVLEGAAVLLSLWAIRGKVQQTQ
jgi:simple sugar transport system permease protein